MFRFVDQINQRAGAAVHRVEERLALIRDSRLAAGRTISATERGLLARIRADAYNQARQIAEYEPEHVRAALEPYLGRIRDIASRASSSIRSTSSRWGSEISEFGSESSGTISAARSFISDISSGSLSAEEASGILASTPAFLEFTPVVLALAAVFGTVYVAYELHRLETQRRNGKANTQGQPQPAGVLPKDPAQITPGSLPKNGNTYIDPTLRWQ